MANAIAKAISDIQLDFKLFGFEVGSVGGHYNDLDTSKDSNEAGDLGTLKEILAVIKGNLPKIVAILLG